MSRSSSSGRPIGLAAAPGRALLLVAVLLPAILFALAAWQNRREVLREADARVERNVRVLNEHASKVFETHRLVIDQINERLRAIDWSAEADRAALHELLKRHQMALDQIATITMTDADGRMRASSRTHPARPEVSFADRDWYQALKGGAYDRLYVSRSYVGRQSGQPVFNVAARVFSRDGGFDGATAISVDRGYFERFYASIEPNPEDTVVLIREDGTILARVPRTDQTVVPPDAPLMQAIGRGSTRGLFESVSRIDGITRIFGYAKVDPYPVYVGYGLSKETALAAWRNNLLTYGLVAALSSLALLAVSALVIRHMRRERLATARWQQAAGELRAAAAQRAVVEAQLRQAQKMEAVGRLTGGVAHDFNNLLTVVLGSLDLLRRRLADGDERSARLVGNALEGARRAASLTARLLAFSRQQALEPKSIDPNRLVAGMSEMLRRTLGETVEIETVLAGGLWPTFVDPNQLENAILNLAVNARDAMPEGGKLTIETANAHLDEAYAALHTEVEAGQYVMIAVCDTGSGMKREVIERAFDPFFTTKPVGQGTGLGLSQVYGFTRQSGGHAAIYSEPGQGTTVKLYLPRARQGEERGPDAIAPEPLQRPGEGETILVVEDEEIVRRFTVAALSEAGYRVLEAADGPSGLDRLRAAPEVALLFTDVVLAGPMDGRKVADEALTLRPGLAVLFTTGYTRNAIIHHGRLDDGVNFLGKPFTTAALVAKVQALLGRG